MLLTLPTLFLALTDSPLLAQAWVAKRMALTEKDPQAYGALTVKLLTINTWNCGAHVDDGLAKLARNIRQADPDIVAFQELDRDLFKSLLEQLGEQWLGVHRSVKYAGTGIATKHYFNRSTLVDTAMGENGATGVQVILHKNGHRQKLNVWSVHTDSHSYGPYEFCSRPTLSEAELDVVEKSRIENILELGNSAAFKAQLNEADEIPFVLMGDMNAPSHLDWTAAAEELHCNRSITWPISIMLQGYGLVDSIREIYPDPVVFPGITWSPTDKFDRRSSNSVKAEPQDRLDFIYYKSCKVRPLDVLPFAGVEPMILLPIPDHRNNTWPSDHYAVLGEFTICAASCGQETRL